MFLIQLGGSAMTFAVLILAALGLNVGLTGQMYLRDDLNQSSIYQLMMLVRIIFKVVLICELAGRRCWRCRSPVRTASGKVWETLFHSVSAFNNAGFRRIFHRVDFICDGSGGQCRDPAFVHHWRHWLCRAA